MTGEYRDEFRGNPAPLTQADFERAARRLQCPVAAMRAVAEVESRGSGFQPDGRPVILFERHWFHRLTGGRFDADHPHISHPRWGGYGPSGRQYDRLEEAIALDREAALKSTSWGAFQIMGFNHAAAGHEDVEGFVAAMVAGSGRQLDAFVAFIAARGLAEPLRRGDWQAFARAYNGPQYARNRYDAKLAEAFLRHGGRPACESEARPVLRQGARGTAVRMVQRRLGVGVDGIFGPATRRAVLAFQRGAGLVADAVVGRLTWAALLRDDRQAIDAA